MSHRLLLATAEGFWQPEQDGLTMPYVERYFAELPAAVARYTPRLTARLAAEAFPRFAVHAETEAAARDLLDRDGLPAALRRAVLDGTDDLRRALAARAVATA
jgi:aminopeptidase N